MRTAKTILFFCLILLVIPMIYAQPPFEPQVAGGVDILELRVPQAQFIKQNQDVQVNIHVFNKSTGLQMNNDSIACDIHIFGRTGFHVNRMMLGFDGEDFELNISGSNFSTLGRHSFIINCNSSTTGGFVSSSIFVTETGFEQTDKGMIPLILTVLFVIVFYMFLIRFFVIEIFAEHGAIKMLLLMMTLWFMLIPIGIITEMNTFIAGSPDITSLLETLYMLLMWINIFITFYFIVWFLVQMLKKIGKTKDKIKLSNE